MEKPEQITLYHRKLISGRFTKTELVRLLLNLAPYVTDWGPIRVQLAKAGATRDQIQTLDDEDRKERPNKKKRGRRTERPSKYTAEEWRRFKDRERQARRRAKLKKEKNQ